MRKRISVDNCEYVESRTVCGYKLFYRIDKDYNDFYGEGNIFKYEDDKMIFVGSSKFNGENSEVHYTEEFREPIYEKLLKELKKEYQNERRRFRARYKGLEEDEFFKESLDEIKKNFETKARTLKFNWGKWWIC